MSKAVKKAWNIITTLIVAVAVILALLLVGARIVGLQVYTVLSGSMEPAYQIRFQRCSGDIFRSKSAQHPEGHGRWIYRRNKLVPEITCPIYF